MQGNIVWGDDHKFDDGFYPSVAINDNGTVVEVHESQWRRALFYRVGTVKEEDMTITWSKEGSSQYDSGMAPAVALNNKGEIVEVHITNKLRSYTTFYHVGTLQESSDIMWSDSHSYGEGSRPQVAINDKGMVVEVHEMVQLKNTTAYVVGQIQSSELATADIGWGPMTVLGNGCNPHIAINNDNQVVEVHEMGFRDIFYSGGIIHQQPKAIAGISDGKEYENHKLCDGISPAVAMNDDGKIAFVCETSNQLWHTLLCHTGTWPEDSD